MRGQRPLQSGRNRLAALALGSMTAPAAATDLIDAWRAAQQHDLDFAMSRAVRSRLTSGRLAENAQRPSVPRLTEVLKATPSEDASALA